jgi:hypothetical protein
MGAVDFNFDSKESKELQKVEDEIEILNRSRVTGRVNQTMFLAGPALLCDALSDSLSLSSGNIDQLVCDLGFPLINLIIKCDNNWQVTTPKYSSSQD